MTVKASKLLSKRVVAVLDKVGIIRDNIRRWLGVILVII